jgi:hypothetical protein
MQGQAIGGLAQGAGAIASLFGPGSKPFKANEGGEVPDSSGPKSLVGKHYQMLNSGGYTSSHAARGIKVPGQPVVNGDSPKNDKVPAMLSPGEIVIPRSASIDPEKAAAFARAVAMRHSRK